MKNKIYNIVLQLEQDGKIEYEVGHRGGTYGARATDVLVALFNDREQEKLGVYDFTPKVGVYVNYLGGGLRGGVCRSETRELPKWAVKRVEKFIDACARRYEEIENEGHLNDEELPDGETNWDAVGTNASRRAGVKSAY